MTREKEIHESAIKITHFAQFGYNGKGLLNACEAFILGAKWADAHPKPGMVNKQEFIEKLEKWIRNNTDWTEEYIWDGRNPNYGLWDELKKFMEE